MFQRILVPLDGSLRAERALSMAARLARASRGTVILLRVVEAASEEDAALSGASALARRSIRAQQDEAQQYLATRALAKEIAGIPLTLMVRSGPVVSTILAVARTFHADLLVLCRQDDWREPPSTLDDMAEQCLEQSEIPLLLLPAYGEILRNENHPLTFLVAFELAHPERSLLEAAVALLTSLARHETGGAQGLSPCTLRAVPVASLAGDQPGEQKRFDASQKPPVRQQAVDVPRQERQNKRGLGTSAGRGEGDLLVLGIPAPRSARVQWMRQQRKERVSSSHDLPLLLVPLPAMDQAGAAREEEGVFL